MIVAYQAMNPNGILLMECLQKPQYRHIIMYGGSSSGKSYAVAQVISLLTILEGSSTLVMRKVGASILDSIYADFKSAIKQLKLEYAYKFTDGTKTIKCLMNQAKIVFKGCDDSEKIKGISSFKRVVLDEWSEFTEQDTDQIGLRLRGKKGQQVVYTFNPISEDHWIKRKRIDTEVWHDVSMRITTRGVKMPLALTRVKSLKRNSAKMIMNKRTGELEEHLPDTILMQSTYLNNFWVVGSPDGKYGYYDEQCIAEFEKVKERDPNYYNVYALGEWGVLQSGNEFFNSFKRGEHTNNVGYNSELPIHISVDDNVLPYITCTIWQIDVTNGKHLQQVGEVCAEPPSNSVRSAARLLANWLKNVMYVGKVYVHGDASTRAANTIDENRRSFIDLYIETLKSCGYSVVDMVGNKNPNVAMSGEFINAILDESLPGLSIGINENCAISVGDYMQVQKDQNGGILKTRIRNKITNQSYEQRGHCSDTFRYVVCDLMREEFTQFSNKRKRNLYAQDGMVHYFNPDTSYQYDSEMLYAMPNINGQFVLAYGKRVGNRWHIVDAMIRQTTFTDEIKECILNKHCDNVVIECSQAYYPIIRELRDKISDVRLIKESGQYDKRISATSDYIRDNILFDYNKSVNNEDYANFLDNMLDYNTSESKEASIVISGFAKYVCRLQQYE